MSGKGEVELGNLPVKSPLANPSASASAAAPRKSPASSANQEGPMPTLPEIEGDENSPLKAPDLKETAEETLKKEVFEEATRVGKYFLIFFSLYGSKRHSRSDCHS